MANPDKYIIGTSGYSFGDWVGPFYPPGTQKRDMLDTYTRAFHSVEINYTFYRMPAARTLQAMCDKTPPGFSFWIKANQTTTHEGDANTIEPFMESLLPMITADKLAGVLLQFPQRFHRTVANRKFLAAALERYAQHGPVPLAVEFRHFSWQHPATLDGLRARDTTLVIPDVPPIRNLYRHKPTATSNTAYLRLHSRNADSWYGGPIDRYDYSYSPQELRDILAEWEQVEQEVDRVYAYFNNCHRAQAAQNAEEFGRILAGDAAPSGPNRR
ncbi:MAG: DUF72 domain-containing protein [Phycisphaerae bacterium]